jgi:hypothetical protein
LFYFNDEKGQTLRRSFVYSDRSGAARQVETVYDGTLLSQTPGTRKIMKSVNKMGDEVKTLYVLALGKKPLDFRIWAAGKAIMAMYAEAMEEETGLKVGSMPAAPYPRINDEVAQMILDYVRFNETTD